MSTYVEPAHAARNTLPPLPIFFHTQRSQTHAGQLLLPLTLFRDSAGFSGWSTTCSTTAATATRVTTAAPTPTWCQMLLRAWASFHLQKHLGRCLMHRQRGLKSSLKARVPGCHLLRHPRSQSLCSRAPAQRAAPIKQVNSMLATRENPGAVIWQRSCAFGRRSTTHGRCGATRRDASDSVRYCN